MKNKNENNLLPFLKQRDKLIAVSRRLRADDDSPSPLFDDAPSELPDTKTLANLAAQPRFTSLQPDDAARAALTLWHESARAVEGARLLDVLDEKHRKELGALPLPDKWPATLDDFYGLIVNAKDKAENQPRFKRYRLCYWCELLANIGEPKMTAKAELDWQEKDLRRFQDEGFAEVESWLKEARRYLAWWKRELTETKRRGGLARAAKEAAGKTKEIADNEKPARRKRKP